MLSFLVDNYLNWLPSLKSIILPGFAGRLTESTQQIDCSVWFTFWKRMVSKAWKIWHYSCRKCTDIHEEKALNCIFRVLRKIRTKSIYKVSTISIRSSHLQEKWHFVHSFLQITYVTAQRQPGSAIRARKAQVLSRDAFVAKKQRNISIYRGGFHSRTPR